MSLFDMPYSEVEVRVLSTLEPPSPTSTCPLLPFEEQQLSRLRSAFISAPDRVRHAFLGLDQDPYQWFSPHLLEPK